MKRVKIKYAVLLFIFLITIIYVFRENFMKDETYGVYIGYPTGYISEFNNAHSVLLNERDEIITRFGGDNGTTGQLGHGVQNSSNELTEIPSKIEVMWFSIIENQFWHGEFELPKQELKKLLNDEKVLDLFLGREGNQIKKYRQIIVNVAPKGKVYVYVGGAAIQLIGTYQAKAIEYDWEQHVKDTRWITSDSVIKSRKEYLEGFYKDYSDVIYDWQKSYKEDYFRPVSWTLSMKGGEELLAYMTDTLNGENIHVLKQPTQEVVKSIPKRITFDIIYNNQPKRLTIIFNKPYEFFKENFDYRSKVKIIIDTPNENETFVYFQQGEKLVEFEDIRVQERDR